MNTTMNTSAFTIALALTGLVSASQARVIVEDFDGADFNSELNFDFSSDFTGGGDTNDHIDGVLWLYSDLANVTVNSLAPGEYIDSVEVTWSDFCGVGCTVLAVMGDNNMLMVGNTDFDGSETVMLSSMDLGEPITSFSISSFEGRFEFITVNVVPSPSALAMLGLGGLMVTRKRR